MESVTAYIPGTLNGSTITGTYEDTNWQITAGTTTLLVDVGTNAQEIVGVSAVGSGPGGGASITFTCTKQHARGCALMINNTLLGNPGPQPNFNYKSPVYSPVIPVVVQLQ